jgi:serine/threonine protein phosphatase 1
MGRIFAVGDIHGCVDKLEALLDSIDIDFNDDLLLFVGDYIDRGPDSFAVVDRLVRLKKQYPERIITLRGNHEDMFLDFLSGDDEFSFLANGGTATLESYERHMADARSMPADHSAFFQSLAMYHETEDYIFVHAGMKPRVPLERQSSHDLLWIRNRFIRSKYDFGKIVVFGHTPFREPLMEPNKIGIDTGAVYGRKLTCLQLPDYIFFFAQ